MMNKLLLPCAVLAFSQLVAAQCTSATPPASGLRTLTPFGGNFYLGAPNPLPGTYRGFSMLADLTVTGPVTMTQAGVELYDYGVGNPPNPNQAGNQGVVNFWITNNAVTTWNGQHQLLPISLGGTGNWQLAGSGTVTVNGAAGESVIAIAAPGFVLPAGQYGLMVEVRPPTAGTNAGPLHCLLYSPPITSTTVSNQWVTLSNQALQNDSFSSGAGPNNQINLRLAFNPAANSGYSTQYGAGCYFSPQFYHEQFAAPTNFDMQSTAYQHVFLGDRYVVAPLAPSPGITPPATVALNLGPEVELKKDERGQGEVNKVYKLNWRRSY
jgi:hypothetical protein